MTAVIDSIIFLIATITILNVPFIRCQSVNFTDCGNGNVKDVRIFPCIQNNSKNTTDNNVDGKNSLCVIELGTNVTVEADFIAPNNTNKLYEVIKGVIRGREMPFPQQQIDPCNSGNIRPSCPLRKDESYQFKAAFEVKPYYPPITLKISYMLTDPIGQKIACVQIGAKIIDPKKKLKKSNKLSTNNNQSNRSTQRNRSRKQTRLPKN